MPDINSALVEITSALDTASAAARILDAQESAAERELATVRQALTELTALRQRAVQASTQLRERNTSVNGAANAYFERIAAVREALAANGEISEANRNAQRDAIQAALAALPDNTPINDLLARVRAYDDATSRPVSDARRTLEDAETAATQARTRRDEASAALDAAERTVLQLAAFADQVRGEARSYLDAIQGTLTGGRPYEAVVDLYDFDVRRGRLVAPVSLVEPPSFDADATDRAALTAAVVAAWTAAMTAYETAAGEAFTTEEDVNQARLALAAAEAEATRRQAERRAEAAAPPPPPPIPVPGPAAAPAPAPAP